MVAKIIIVVEEMALITTPVTTGIIREEATTIPTLATVMIIIWLTLGCPTGIRND